jgi:hypothetical protein
MAGRDQTDRPVSRLRFGTKASRIQITSEKHIFWGTMYSVKMKATAALYSPETLLFCFWYSFLLEAE